MANKKISELDDVSLTADLATGYIIHIVDVSEYKTRSTGVGIAVTGNYLASGISTFPTIQRRGFGIRSNGALRKDLG